MAEVQVIIEIEQGAAMITMDMMGSMFDAREQSKGSGIYIVTLTPDIKGIYTLHTHVNLPGAHMYSMMDNHIDIGVLAQ